MNFKKLSLLLLAAAFCLSGCNSVPQPTLEELLSDINAKHQAIERTTADPSIYMGDKIDNNTVWSYLDSSLAQSLDISSKNYDPEKILTRKQAEEDITYLFDAFHDVYGPYEYFGGAEVFDSVENEIKSQLQSMESITAQELEQLLLKHLNFIKDTHFSINGSKTTAVKVPFFFREVAFVKTDDGYRTSDGKKVESIEGYELDEIMKLSISPEGHLVYYPVLLKDCNYIEAGETPQICDETLILIYSNGKTQELRAEDFLIYTDPNEEILFSRQHGDIPVFQFDLCDPKHVLEILDGANALKDASVSILDIRSNPGGNEKVAVDWLRKYSGTYGLSRNQLVVNTKTHNTQTLAEKDTWTENDETLFILQGKRVSSGAECLVDYAHNIENIIFVGENTMGCLIGSGYPIDLPNSNCTVQIGQGLFTVPRQDDYFEELRGFYPDIWVPAAEAEELVVKMIEQLSEK